jgi:hypothetical protein
LYFIFPFSSHFYFKLHIMDIGESKNAYSKKTSKSEAGSTGLFKIGDYDSQPSAKSNEQGAGDEGLMHQLADSIKNQAHSVSDKLTGGGSSKKK